MQLFGSMEFQAGSLRALPQWNRVIEAMKIDHASLGRCLREAAACGSAALSSWRQIMAAATHLDRRQKIEAVNKFFNRWPYKIDQEIYGVSEYWATPIEFMSKSGDCEDFSIAKFYALRELGFANDELRVVALWDRIRGIGHAILAVYIDDDILILDNLSDILFSHTRYSHYDPQYSVNETSRWAHIRGVNGTAPRAQ